MSSPPSPAPARVQPPAIRLRRTTEADLRSLHSFELDPVSNELAGSKPRDWPTFLARWEAILADANGTETRVTPRVILADDVLVGSINISPYTPHTPPPHPPLDSLGYWIARPHWGRSIATRAVTLMLQELTRDPHAPHSITPPPPPLYATTAGHNHASLRILHRHGFEIVSRQFTPETRRTLPRETLTLVLSKRAET